MPKVCFEASWEVCNKVGGINTVIKSKAELMSAAYEQYYLIGPYFKEKANLELEITELPKEFKTPIKDLEKQGLKIYYGKWNIKGKPNVFLIDFSNFTQNEIYIKEKLWEWFQVDSYATEWEYTEPVLWSYASGLLIDSLTKNNPSVVGHFHEWLSGAGLLYLKKNTSVKTVFTTHATILGRSISGSDHNLYEMLDSLEVEKASIEYGVRSKHDLERAAAQNASIFTTVSEITGREATKILGRKPEVLVLNGLDLAKFPTIEETSIKHLNGRAAIREYLAMHFFPHYQFDLEHNLSFFYVGRYEYHNKGLDIIVEALGMLNEYLKKQKSPRTISFFFWVLRGSNGVKAELLQNRFMYRQIKDAIEEKSEEIIDRLTKAALVSTRNVEDCSTSILPIELINELHQDKIRFKREGNPTMSTHDIGNEEEDILITNLKRVGLDNREDDNVKVIVEPANLDGHDGLINLPYFDAMAGCHLGMFPSFYEPWGYTPLEAAAIGVSAITTDLSGFGRFIEPKLFKENSGIYILHADKKQREEIINELFDQMKLFADMDHAERVQNKINAKQISIFADWKHLVKNYFKAHEMALEKK